MKRIEYISLFFKVFFQITFISLIIAQFVGWFDAPRLGGFFNVIPASYQSLVLHRLDTNTKVAGFFVSSMPFLIKLAIIYFLIKLFQLYQQQKFFTALNVFYIRNIGYALLIFEIIKPLSDFVLGFILTSGNPPGYRIAMITFDDANIGVILTSLVIILNSWVMSEACKLKDEQQLII